MTRVLMVRLPDAEQLLAAISGYVISDGSALVGWARELAELHAAALQRTRMEQLARPRSANRGIDTGGEIAAVVDAIDGWVATHVERERSAPMHTHSMGQVISHIAETYVRAWWMVLHCADADLSHQAWSRLAEARQGYTALLAEIQTGHRQLPLGWQGIRGPAK